MKGGYVMKAIYYINQFFGQIGGEDKADMTPIIKAGVIGPGVQLQKLFGVEMEIVATVICGDTYFAEHSEEASEFIISRIKEYNPDVFIAGPAFNAGRYGIACGAICQAVQDKLNIPAITSMYNENPGVDLYKKEVYILQTGASAAMMRDALQKLSKFALKITRGEEIGFPEEEGYVPQGRRVNIWSEKTGGVRAVEMLLKKLKGENFVTELPMPLFDRVVPAPAIKNLREATIALVTSGGIVPLGNPDFIESANASKWGKYLIKGVNDLTSNEFETVHGGYDPVYALKDPDRVLPLDAMRELEKENKIGRLFEYFYTTVGNTTAVSSAYRYGEEIGKDLIANGVDGVILTST
jgi:glycine reductase complex component B subunit gamma